MGLGSGLVIFLVCLSGTIYTFRTEIERLVEPGKYYASGIEGKEIMSTDSLVAIIEEELDGKLTSVMVPADKNMNWQMSFKKIASQPSPKDAPKSKTYFVNPYTAAIAGEPGGTTSDFFGTVMKIHRWLLLGDKTGRVIVGIATLIMFFMVMTGLILWFPARLKNLKQGLKIKTSANWKRVNHDLHNTLGFYSFTILLIMTLTGLCWSFEWYRNGLSSVLGAKVFKGRTEKPLLSDEKKSLNGEMSVAIFLSKTERYFPYEGNLRLSIPEDINGAITVTKSATGFFSVAGVDRVIFDRFTGDLLKLESFSNKPFNSQIADSIKLIHTGEIFGTLSKLVYFLACLIATSLPITGTMIWLNKMKKKQRNAQITWQKQKEFA
jgi:uncharacterized iron-regulated membrane protein